MDFLICQVLFACFLPSKFVSWKWICVRFDDFFPNGIVQQFTENLEVGVNGVGGVTQFVPEVVFILFEKVVIDFFEGQVTAFQVGFEFQVN